MGGLVVQDGAKLARVQRHRKMRLKLAIAAFFVCSLLLSSISAPDAAFHEDVESLGALLIIFAILGRTWCTLYIGGRKRQEIVDTGPYSLSRNPLYVFSLIGAAGVGFCTGMLSLGALTFAMAFWVFSSVVAQEEAFLTTRFGKAYTGYCAQVPRWWPVGAWRGVEEITIRPGLVVTTFLEASLMLLAFPLMEGIDRLHALGHLPVLVWLP